MPHKTPSVLEVVDAVEQAITAQPSPYDRHPSPRDRFTWVHALEHGGGSGNLVDAGGDGGPCSRIARRSNAP